MLCANLILGLVLFRQAYDTARSHRRAAESVLRDYASLAGNELLRRSTAAAGYRGYYPLITALGQSPITDLDRDLPTPASWLAGADEELRHAGALAAYLFRAAPDGRLEIAGHRSSGVDAWLASEIARLLQAAPDKRPYIVLHTILDGRAESAVCTRLEPAAPTAAFVGFGVARDELAPWFQAALASGPLLPPSLGGGGVGNEALLLRIVDPAGRELFRSAAPERFAEAGPRGPDLAVTLPFGAEYQGIFEGTVIHAQLDPAAASQLLIGGLPSSRVPGLLGLLAVNVGLLATAVLQLRRARALERLRSDLVSRVSHELRTPLAQIRMFAETLLLGRVRTPEERQRSLEIIDQEARRLGHLVENVLQFSRGERGAVQLDRRTRELGPIIAAVVSDFQPLAATAQLRLVRCDVAHAEIDDDALRQILLNLLDNAVKYGPPGQEAQIGVETVGSAVRIWVEDQGPGVPLRERERIWGSFERLERDRRSAVAGTGIGLAVVRELVALHGGRAWVTAGERTGARFTVELPAVDRARGEVA